MLACGQREGGRETGKAGEVGVCVGRGTVTGEEGACWEQGPAVSPYEVGIIIMLSFQMKKLRLSSVGTIWLMKIIT